MLDNLSDPDALLQKLTVVVTVAAVISFVVYVNLMHWFTPGRKERDEEAAAEEETYLGQ